MNYRLVTLAMWLAIPARADALADAFARMDATARTFKGMTAGLQRTDYTALAKDTSVATGDIKLKRSKSGDIHILVNLVKPDQEIVAFDGREAKVYYPKTNIEHDYDATNKRDMVEQVLALGFGKTSADLKMAYEISFLGKEAIGNQSTAHLRLLPKSKELAKSFRQVELWISDSLGVPLRQKFVTSANGDFHEFTYSDLKLTPNLSDKDLQLKPDKRVQIKRVG